MMSLLERVGTPRSTSPREADWFYEESRDTTAHVVQIHCFVGLIGVILALLVLGLIRWQKRLIIRIEGQ